VAAAYAFISFFVTAIYLEEVGFLKLFGVIVG